jgi:pentatricopeptide repeat protein
MCAGFYNESADLLNKTGYKGIKPDNITYTTIIHGYRAADMTEKALQLFEIMKKSGCPPRVETYNTIS